jgi:hypothetical protein
MSYLLKLLLHRFKLYSTPKTQLDWNGPFYSATFGSPLYNLSENRYPDPMFVCASFACCGACSCVTCSSFCQAKKQAVRQSNLYFFCLQTTLEALPEGQKWLQEEQGLYVSFGPQSLHTVCRLASTQLRTLPISDGMWQSPLDYGRKTDVKLFDMSVPAKPK